MTSGATPQRAFAVTTSGTVLIHVDFLITGIVMTFLGPMLPHLSARWSLNDTQSGALIFAEFFSSMFGMLLSGFLVQRVGYRLTLMLGLILMPAGMTLLAFSSFALGIVAICIFGIGYGVTTPAGNLRTAEINPARSASALNVINAVWGVGAMSSPFLVAIALRAHRPDIFLFGTSAALLVLLVILTFSHFVPDTHAEAGQNLRSTNLWTIRILPLICLLFFVYVGSETSFGNWVAMYARRVAPSDRTFATLTPSFFWGAILAGRALAPIALKFARPTTVAKIGLALAVLGGIVLVMAKGIGLITVGSLLAGFGLSSIFPISVSLFPKWFGDSARRASGAIFGSGNIGGAVMPWAVGLVSTQSHSLRLGIAVPLLGSLLMLVFYLVSDVSRRESTA
jgi:MFS transporter, FHS family, glucose/mannose:H+ symporter